MAKKMYFGPIKLVFILRESMSLYTNNVSKWKKSILQDSRSREQAEDHPYIV